MPGPKINDDYWFAVSENLVNRAQEAREQAAEKIQNLVLWLWGIYTASAAAGFALAAKDLNVVTALAIGLASASLIFVYWGSVWVRIPKLVRFDPRSPEQIEAAFGDIIRAKHFRLKITLWLSALAAFMVAFSLLIASLAKKQPELMPPSLLATAESIGGNTDVAVTAAVGQVKEVRIDVHDPANKSLTKSGVGRFLTKDGRVHVNLPVEGSPPTVIVTIEWKDSTGMTTRLSKDVVVEKKTPSS